MKIRFIINPISGTGKQKGIKKYISKYVKNSEIVFTEKAGDATRLSKEATKKNIDAGRDAFHWCVPGAPAGRPGPRGDPNDKGKVAHHHQDSRRHRRVLCELLQGRSPHRL